MIGMIIVSCGIFSTGILIWKNYYRKPIIVYTIFVGRGKHPNFTYYPLLIKKYKNNEEYERDEKQIREITGNPLKNYFLRDAGITVINIVDKKNNLDIFSTVLNKWKKNTKY